MDVIDIRRITITVEGRDEDRGRVQLFSFSEDHEVMDGLLDSLGKLSILAHVSRLAELRSTEVHLKPRNRMH